MVDCLENQERLIISTKTLIPTIIQTKLLWDKYAMLDNIRRHSKVVAAVAMLICEWLEESGWHLNQDIVKIGALLHDIAKTFCLGSNRRHDIEGQRILVEQGYPKRRTI